MIDTCGRILLEGKGVVKEAADGHGGVFKAMLKNGVIEEMDKLGIEWVFTGNVDNVLLKLVDPLVLGLAIHNKVLAAAKTVIKLREDEKRGTFCKKNGRPCVLEYTEIPKEIAGLRDIDGNLVYREASVNINLFNINVIKQTCKKELKYHTAFKKASYINRLGEKVEPTEANAYKFETFIFDVYQDLESIVLMRGVRDEEFAPVKNRTGENGPEIAKKLYELYMEKYKQS